MKTKIPDHQEISKPLAWVLGTIAFLLTFSILGASLFFGGVFQESEPVLESGSNPQSANSNTSSGDLPGTVEVIDPEFKDTEDWPTPMYFEEFWQPPPENPPLIVPFLAREMDLSDLTLPLILLPEEYGEKGNLVGITSSWDLRIRTSPTYPIAIAKKKKDKVPSAAEVTILGSTGKGQRFCIIADCSGSMKGAPLMMVKHELLKNLASLKEESQFFVAFFNTNAFPMPARDWVHGGKKSIETLTPWVASVSAGGGTNPIPALQMALQLNPRPDVIFLMTDGIFHLAIPEVVRKMNQQGPKVKINTILFSWAGPQPQAAAQLRKMADDAGGAFSTLQAFPRR